MEKLLVRNTKNVSDKDQFIGIQMALSHFNLGHGAAGHITSRKLKLSRQRILSHARLFSEGADVGSNLFFDLSVHNCLAFPIVIDFIINLWYNKNAPI